MCSENINILCHSTLTSDESRGGQERPHPHRVQRGRVQGRQGSVQRLRVPGPGLGMRWGEGFVQAALTHRSSCESGAGNNPVGSYSVQNSIL